MNVSQNAEILDFGLFDFVLKNLTFNGQDFTRLLIAILGPLNTPISYQAVLGGLCLALNSFEKNCSKVNQSFLSFSLRVIETKYEVDNLYEQFSLTQSSLIKEKAAFRKWQMLEDLEVRHLNDGVLKYVGAYYCLLLNNHKLNKEMVNVIWQLILNGEEGIGQKQERDLARMLDKACRIFCVKEHQSYFQAVKSFFYLRSIYVTVKTRQSVNDWKAMSTSEFMNASKLVYQLANAGDELAITVVVSFVAGLPLHLMVELPIFNEYFDEWIIALDLNRGLILFELDSIFPGKAKPKQNTSLYEQSGAILTKPLPKFLWDILKELQVKQPEAKVIGDLLHFDAKSSIGFDISRYVNSVARFATNSCQVDPYDAAVLSSDFRSTQSSKSYYRRTTRQLIWTAAERVFQKIGWGEPVEMVEGLAVGSSVVAKPEAIRSIFNNLAKSIEDSRPHSRASIESILAFHDKVCAYTSTLATFCLALRNANPIRIKACDIDAYRQYVVIDDKHVLGEASSQPIVITKSLMKQIAFWRMHCQSTHDRLVKLNFSDKKFLNVLEGVYLQKSTSLFVFSTHLYAASVSEVSKYWSSPLVENFARHFWETEFQKHGISSRFSAAQLRHQSHGTLSWSAESDFVLCEFIRQITVAQEKVLSELNIHPVHGLSKRLAR